VSCFAGALAGKSGGRIPHCGDRVNANQNQHEQLLAGIKQPPQGQPYDASGFWLGARSLVCESAKWSTLEDAEHCRNRSAIKAMLRLNPFAWIACLAYSEQLSPPLCAR